MYAAPGQTFEARVQGFPTGLVGTARVRILDNVGGTSFGPSTAGIAEDPAGSGSYVVTLTAPAAAGQYTVLWDRGSVSPSTIAVDELVVQWTLPSAPAPTGVDLCTVTDVKNAMEPSLATAARDARIQELITDASRSIMRLCEREFAPATAAATRRFRVPLGGSDGLVDLAPYDLRSASSVTLHPESSGPLTLTSAEYMLEPLVAPLAVYNRLRLSAYVYLVSDFALRFGFAQIDVAGAWGFASVPEDVKGACVLTVRSWLQQNPAAYAFAGIDGQQPGPAPAPPATWFIPPGALKKLGPFRRWS